MYGALRSGLRASYKRPPARTVSQRRYPLPPSRTRAFHASRSLARDTDPPQDPDSKPAGNKDAENKKEEGAAGEAAEDADFLAQKLQRSREMTRRYSSALRRSQRKNRAQDLPPVVVPGWFVDECVRLSDEVPIHEPLRQFVLELRRRGTDESGACSIPVSAPGDAVQLLSEFLFYAWGSGLSNDEKRRFVRQWALSAGLPDSEEVLHHLENGGDGSVFATRSQHWLQKEHLSRDLRDLKAIRSKVDEDCAQLIYASQSLDLARQKGQITAKDVQTVEAAIESLAVRNHPTEDTFPSFVVAEIRAHIAASLSDSQPASSDSFPATKTNLILHCPSNNREKQLARLVGFIAAEQGADVIALHAQDLAEIAGDYLGDLPDPSPHSIRSLAYETYRLSSDLEAEPYLDETGKDDFGEESEDATAPTWPSSSAGPKSVFPTIILPKLVTNALKALQVPAQEPSTAAADTQPRSHTQAESQLEDLKIANVLENLIDASETKRSQKSPQQTPDDTSSTRVEEQGKSTFGPAFFNSSMSSNPASDELVIDAALPHQAIPLFSLAVNVGSDLTATKNPGNVKIIYIPDFKELNATHYGGRIIEKLEEIVRKRRTAGERIMIVGSTSSAELTPELSKSGVRNLQSEGEAGYYRTIVVPAEKVANSPDVILASRAPSKDARKYYEVNIRHIFDMLRRLDPIASQHLSARRTEDSSRASLALARIASHSLGKILTYDEVHRVALTALGLHTLDPASKSLTASHVALAIGLLRVSDQAKFEHVKREALRPPDRMRQVFEEKLRARMKGTSTQDRDRDLERKLEKVSATASKHEKRLMPGIANPAQIKTTFDQIHVPSDTIDSIRTLTSLSLLRPDAFNYGVLATEKISGALLYGPPGTGKTLLAKAVAKESGSTVLEVSGSQIMDKYVGEGEKNVTAVFSLARKLSPCIVFLDEADAIFSSRDVGRERTSHRDILNQFLKEWDGLNDLSVFVMVATNRPFDLDDAVIRRLPRRLLVDLPTEKDRAAILKIHLRGEQLDASVDLADIAKRTPFYSGSDLKNLAVSAALACVKEENEQAAIAAAKRAAEAQTQTQAEAPEAPAGTDSTPKDSKPAQLVRGHDYKFPEKRTLHKRHFDAALQEISASISEDMSSLNAIKKFDEKYGDRKGKKQKHVFGIGVDKGTNEDVVRVRP